MLHKMSEIRGWTHEQMMCMGKRVFYRYYGYWYAEQLMKDEYNKRLQREQESKNRMNNL